MRLNYKKLLKEIEESDPCDKALRPFAYFVENKMYKQARAMMRFYAKWLSWNTEIRCESLQNDFSVLEIAYKYDGTLGYAWDYSDRKGNNVVGKLRKNPKYIIPPDYVYTKINGRELKHDPS